VDQHAFHERILFERFKADPKLLGSRQPLLVPELVDLFESQVALARDLQTELASLGFTYRILDDRSLELLAVPVLLTGRDVVRGFHEVLTAIANLGAQGAVEVYADPILATLACHSAVRQGDLLSEDERLSLLREADNVDFFHNCPHGRRVLRWFERKDVERWFDR
jgi:DNA mismatch repair protein MutL